MDKRLACERKWKFGSYFCHKLCRLIRGKKKRKVNFIVFLFVQVNDLRLLSKFFTRLCTLDDDSASVISLLRESLFLFKFRGHPIAASVLNEWPDIFPRDARESKSAWIYPAVIRSNNTFNFSVLFFLQELCSLILFFSLLLTIKWSTILTCIISPKYRI